MGARLGNDEESISDINITPFVDVVLVLLVIFMVTAPLLAKDSFKIKLPKATAGDGTAKLDFGIAINQEGQILLNGKIVSIDDLKKEAKIASATNPEAQAVTSADKEAKHGVVISVIDAIKTQGLNRFAFQIERKE